MLQHPLFDSNIILDVSAVSKKFSYSLANARKYGSKDLLRSMLGLNHVDGQLRKGEFWAVRDVSFQLKQGETLGIIGLNGSGKSTILKMINGLYMPDEGEILVRGQVGALIELGAGFHPMLSGRENVYIKGAFIGKSKEEMDEIYQKIVDFAELGTFIDSPIKTYSSGMYVRLGFAVSIFMDPDILLMDEVMAVGDFRFRQKCQSKINEFRDKMSIVFVSHSMNNISMFCDKVLVMNKGAVEFEGKPEQAIKYYLSELENKEEIKKQESKTVEKKFYGDLYHNKKKIRNIKHEFSFANGDNKGDIFDELRLYFSFELLFNPKNLIIGVPVWDINGNFLTAFNTDFDKIKIDPKNGCVEGTLIFRCHFNSGTYVSVFVVVDGSEFIYRQTLNQFVVNRRERLFGYFSLPHKWIITG